MVKELFNSFLLFKCFNGARPQLPYFAHRFGGVNLSHLHQVTSKHRSRSAVSARTVHNNCLQIILYNYLELTLK